MPRSLPIQTPTDYCGDDARVLMQSLRIPSISFQDVMDDPVSTVDGHVYERAAIEEWLRAHGTSPLTGMELSLRLLVPNMPLRNLIREFREKHPDF